LNWTQLVITPIIAAAVGLAVWFVQSRIERIHRAEERLRDERRKIYLTILEPFIRTFTGIKKPEEAIKAQKQIISFDYKRTALEFNLIGSDNVVYSFNNLMQYVYSADSAKDIDTKIMMTLWSELLLEIRRSVGEPRTKLKPVDMLKAQITDIDKIFL